MITLKIKQMERGVNFGRGGGPKQHEIYVEKKGVNLVGNQCVALLSKGKHIVRFIFRASMISREEGLGRTQALTSVDVRIEKGRWSDEMLANYARDNGIKIENWPTWEEWFRDKEVRKVRAKAAA